MNKKSVIFILVLLLIGLASLSSYADFGGGGSNGTATFATKLSAIYKVRDDAKGIYNRFTEGTETVFSVQFYKSVPYDKTIELTPDAGEKEKLLIINGRVKDVTEEFPSKEYFTPFQHKIKFNWVVGTEKGSFLHDADTQLGVLKSLKEGVKLSSNGWQYEGVGRPLIKGSALGKLEWEDFAPAELKEYDPNFFIVNAYQVWQVTERQIAGGSSAYNEYVRKVDAQVAIAEASDKSSRGARSLISEIEQALIDAGIAENQAQIKVSALLKRSGILPKFANRAAKEALRMLRSEEHSALAIVENAYANLPAKPAETFVSKGWYRFFDGGAYHRSTEGSPEMEAVLADAEARISQFVDSYLGYGINGLDRAWATDMLKNLGVKKIETKSKYGVGFDYYNILKAGAVANVNTTPNPPVILPKPTSTTGDLPQWRISKLFRHVVSNTLDASGEIPKDDTPQTSDKYTKYEGDIPEGHWKKSPVDTYGVIGVVVNPNVNAYGYIEPPKDDPVPFSVEGKDPNKGRGKFPVTSHELIFRSTANGGLVTSASSGYGMPGFLINSGYKSGVSGLSTIVVESELTAEMKESLLWNKGVYKFSSQYNDRDYLGQRPVYTDGVITGYEDEYSDWYTVTEYKATSEEVEVPVRFSSLSNKSTYSVGNFVAPINTGNNGTPKDYRKEDGFYSKSTSGVVVNVVPEVLMLYEVNDNAGVKGNFVAGEKQRTINSMAYHTHEFKVNRDSTKSILTGTRVNDKRAVGLAQALGASNNPVYVRGSSVNATVTPTGIYEVKSFILDTNSTVDSHFGNTGINPVQEAEKHLATFGVKSGNGVWKIPFSAYIGLKVNNKEYSVKSTDAVLPQHGNVEVKEHKLTIRGGVVTKIDGVDIASAPKYLQEAVTGMELSKLGVLNVFEVGLGDTPESSFGGISLSMRGVGMQGAGWYHEDSTVIVMTEVVHKFDLVPMSVSTITPLNVVGLETPTNKNKFFSKGKVGYLTMDIYPTKLDSSRMYVDMSKDTNWNRKRTSFVLPNVHVKDGRF